MHAISSQGRTGEVRGFPACETEHGVRLRAGQARGSVPVLSARGAGEVRQPVSHRHELVGELEFI